MHMPGKLAVATMGRSSSWTTETAPTNLLHAAVHAAFALNLPIVRCACESSERSSFWLCTDVRRAQSLNEAFGDSLQGGL